MRPYEYYDDVHTALAYEFDLNLYRVDREAYNLLDWLGDIGGLKEALTIILTFIFTLFNYHTFQDYLVSSLYREETQKDKAARRAKGADVDKSLHLQKFEGHDLQPDKVNCLMQRIHDSDWAICCCKRKSKHYKLLEKGRKNFENEIDIVQFIQNFRMLIKHVELKLKLDHDEKRYVENNRFHKLAVSGSSGSDTESKTSFSLNSPAKSPITPSTNQEHLNKSKEIFKKRHLRTQFNN